MRPPDSLETWILLFATFIAIQFAITWIRSRVLPEQIWKRRRRRRRKATDEATVRYVARLKNQIGG